MADPDPRDGMAHRDEPMPFEPPVDRTDIAPLSRGVGEIPFATLDIGLPGRTLGKLAGNARLSRRIGARLMALGLLLVVGVGILGGVLALLGHS